MEKVLDAGFRTPDIQQVREDRALSRSLSVYVSLCLSVRLCVSLCDSLCVCLSLSMRVSNGGMDRCVGVS